ncbi:hypothetical protein [Phytohabitans rumicis]|uniref:Uncharacterized protein n=1 Tax=Phytohabitans rumicis TaxID=1076125 RepID=A0A6V8L5U4_9ACTN|nr:hypothetical protein [Phytohabitans rumicis]GFJ89989.1 hypothetical protein Prum_036310 [Phytohabitans rumicis]
MIGEQPDQLGDAFAAFREQVLPEVRPTGIDAVQRTVRRRRRRAAVVVAAVTVVAVALPIVAYAGLTDGDRPPGPTDSPSPSTTGSASPTPSPTPSPSMVDGRITREQLLAAAVDLPDWWPGAIDECTTEDVRLRPSPDGTSAPALLDLRHGDVDGDPAAETVVRLECGGGDETARQVVAFDRDGAGQITALGQVVRNGSGVSDLTEFEIASGKVRVLVVGPDRVRQWRTYSWAGDRFRQTGGPTAFASPSQTTAPPAPAFRLTITATDMVYGPVEADSWRRATTTVTIVNASAATVDYPLVTFPRNSRDEAEHAIWSGCPTMQGRPDRIVCVADPLGPGEQRSIALAFITHEDGPPGPATLRVDAGADSDGTVLPGTGQETTFQVSFS